MVNIKFPILSTGQNVTKKLEGTINEVTGSITNADLISKAGKGVDGILKDLGNLVGVIPLAGEATGYVFGKGGDAVKIVTIGANKVVVGSGRLVNGVVSGLSDLVILTLGTAKGLVNKITSLVGLPVHLGGKRRKSRKRRRRKKSRKSRKKRRRSRKRRRR